MSPAHRFSLDEIYRRYEAARTPPWGADGYEPAPAPAVRIFDNIMLRAHPPAYWQAYGEELCAPFQILIEAGWELVNDNEPNGGSGPGEERGDVYWLDDLTGWLARGAKGKPVRDGDADRHGHTHVWRSEQLDLPCVPTGREWSETNNQVFIEITREGNTTSVPKAEVVSFATWRDEQSKAAQKTPAQDEAPNACPPLPVQAETARHLALLDSKASTFTFQTFDDNEERKKALGKENIQRKAEGKRPKPDPLAHTLHGSLDDLWHRLVSLNERGAAICANVCETDGRGRATKNIKRVRAVFIDLDGNPPEPVLEDERKPHFAVESSPGKYHAYWLVKGVRLDDFADIQRGLAERFGGDDVHDLPRVMRLAGFIHRKGSPFRSQIIYENQRDPYTAADFSDLVSASAKAFERFGADNRPSYESPLQRLNTAALANLAAWVLEIFPTAQLQATGGYRVSSADLGRDLEEDLSLHPSGIKDFGVHDMGDPREGKRTPIEIVVEHGKKSEEEAVAWLRERLGLNPAEEEAGDGDRPVLKIKAGCLDIAATQGELVLQKRGYPIYQRQSLGAPVRPVIREVRAAHGRRTKVAQLVAIDPVYMRDLLCRAATWLKFDRREKKWLPTNPPLDIAMTILARAGEWKFPTITGVISTPTMRPDGSILSQEGYDESTGLILLAPPPMPPIPDEPTRGDGLAALALLKGLLPEFPFKGGVDRAVALSGLITPVVRGAFLVAPLHIARAPGPGSGKSYLWDTASAIAIGNLMPVMGAGADEEELEKRLAADLRGSPPLISIDNVNGELGGSALCQVLERPSVKMRILGKSEMVWIEAGATTFYGTGNNITIVGDLCRRVLTLVLDPQLENPELRKFSGNPVRTVLENRGAYIAAALTICRAYIAAGRPNPVDRLASYEDWSDTVASALVWLGEENPINSVELVRKDDPVTGALRAVLSAWADVFGVGYTNRFSLADVCLAANERVQRMDGFQPVWPELAAAVRSATSARDLIDPAKLGLWLRGLKGRIVGDRRFTNDANKSHKPCWWIEGRGKRGEWDEEKPGSYTPSDSSP